MIVSRDAQKSHTAQLPGNGSVLASVRSAQNQGQRSWSAPFLLHVDLRSDTRCEERASRDRPEGSTPWKRSKSKDTLSFFQLSCFQSGTACLIEVRKEIAFCRNWLVQLRRFKERVSCTVTWHFALRHAFQHICVARGHDEFMKSASPHAFCCTTGTGYTRRMVRELDRRVPIEFDETARHQKSPNVNIMNRRTCWMAGVKTY